MAFGISATSWLAIAAITSTAASVGMGLYQADQSRSAQNEANDQAAAAARKQAADADKAFNSANQKKPDLSAIMAAQQQAAKAGGASTMLTGSQGVDPNSLSLGRASLLGQ